MVLDYPRAYEKLSRATHALAGGVGSIQERLVDAADNFCSLDLESEVPPLILEEYTELRALLTAVPGIEGSIRTTCHALSDENARYYAAKIVAMDENMHQHIGVAQGLRQAEHELDAIQIWDKIA